ncbi:hypothetical protein AYL99_10175 [Fonsecaea erecta]|uniref:Major facilitator superfamily (MFS) profile domain-containing protein n=1 Tax=Fonsecaea erecta TaxID=1367422 RepID=A0A178Z9Z5_9EURO|nr:hypothetical protein AYL99_10175 [Fonsecaea erecta]OAP56023.1 hypothetical protein AYL99_10175 [Fonsecaea erecta]
MGVPKPRSWIPSWCCWDIDNPPALTMRLNILYACAAGFTSANLYYSYPILHILAKDFNTSQAGVASIPALAQAGDATGLLLILPLADFLPRRTFTITLLALSMAFWIGLCVTTDLTVFLVLTYLSALFTGTTQIMLPLVAELSHPEKRAFNISIVSAGPTLAILLARILSGIVANYTSWRNVYWLALGLQSSVLFVLWLFMPDYPAINPTSVKKILKTYPKILWTILAMYWKHAVLVQAALLSYCTFFCVSSFWTTLTFLLSEAPYRYSTTIIGLFGLVGAATMILGPLYSTFIVKPLGQPLFSVIVGKCVSLIGIVVGTFAGRHHVAGPIVQALLLDAGLMIVQISNRMAIHPCEPRGGNRINTAFVSVLYLGQLSGTKAGNLMYEKHGGWLASGGLSIGVIGFSYVIALLRGPHETGWIGWSGGWRLKPRVTEPGEDPEAASGKNVSEVKDG